MDITKRLQRMASKRCQATRQGIGMAQFDREKESATSCRFMIMTNFAGCLKSRMFMDQDTGAP
jgi:hypothetical protein